MIKPIATEEERIRLVKECYQSGLTANEWCRRNGISRNTFHTWVNRLRKKGLIETAATIPTVINCEEVHPEIVKINMGNDGQTITQSEIQDLPRTTWQEKSISTTCFDTVMMQRLQPTAGELSVMSSEAQTERVTAPMQGLQPTAASRPLRLGGWSG